MSTQHLLDEDVMSTQHLLDEDVMSTQHLLDEDMMTSDLLTLLWVQGWRGMCTKETYYTNNDLAINVIIY